MIDVALVKVCQSMCYNLVSFGEVDITGASVRTPQPCMSSYEEC